LLLATLAPVIGTSSTGNDGERILKRVDESLRSIEDFIVDLDVTADIERMKMPPMRVRMYFKQPDKVHYESEGFALLPREGLTFSVSRLLSRFIVEGVRDDTVSPGTLRLLQLRPRDERERTMRLEVSIDTARWRPARISSSLFDGRTMTVTFEYEKHDGVLVPSLLAVRFTAPSDTLGPNLDEPGGWSPPVSRNGTITIRYSHYTINSGFPDDIFDKK
jgi:outer membrane lipoprotein-sorting protein